jgi:tetrahydromethanopterin S-methyltransferase subunit F
MDDELLLDKILAGFICGIVFVLVIWAVLQLGGAL